MKGKHMLMYALVFVFGFVVARMMGGRLVEGIDKKCTDIVNNENWCDCCGGKDGQDSKNMKSIQKDYIGNAGGRNSCSDLCDIERKNRTTLTTEEQDKVNACKIISKKLTSDEHTKVDECNKINQKLVNFSWE